jgi:signal peptidase I
MAVELMETNSERSQVPRGLRFVVGRNPKVTLVRIVVLVAVVFLLRAYVLLPIKVKGPSMLPTYQDNGVNFIYRLAYAHSQPKRGDVVAIRFAGTSVMLMKRIIGLPGETIAFHRGRVEIDGKELDEPYMNYDTYPCDWEMPPKTLGQDDYYVVGDNRAMPMRAHEQGIATRQRIVGRVLLCKNLFASSSSRP